MARSTRLVILIKNIYTLWGRNRFLLPVTYFPTNLVYPFTLRVTGIKIGCFLPVTYFPTNLVYPFTLRVTGIKTVSESIQIYFTVPLLENFIKKKHINMFHLNSLQKCKAHYENENQFLKMFSILKDYERDFLKFSKSF